MAPQITMTRQEDIIYLIPHLVESYPREVMAIALVTRDTETNTSEFGPIARKDIDDLGHGWEELVYELVDHFEATDVFLVAYVNDLVEHFANRELINQIDECAFETQRVLDERYRRPDMGFVSAYITDYREWINVNHINADDNIDELRQRGAVRLNDEFKNSEVAAHLAFAGYAVPDCDEIPNINIADQERAESAYRDTHTDQRKKQAVQAVFSAQASPEDYGVACQVIDDVIMRDRLILLALSGSSLDEVWTMKQGIIGEELGSLTTLDESTSSRTRAFDTMAGYVPSHSAPAFGVSAYLRWFAGERASAHDRAVQAVKINPDYSLAKLVLHAIAVELDSPIQR